MSRYRVRRYTEGENFPTKIRCIVIMDYHICAIRRHGSSLWIVDPADDRLYRPERDNAPGLVTAPTLKAALAMHAMLRA
jgi:hypothetical protein